MQAQEPAHQLAMVGKKELAHQLSVSIWTLDRWIRTGQFPKPIQVTPTSPYSWRVKDVEAFLEKRRRARRVRINRGGCLKQEMAGG